jgi:NAD(P)H-hydrate epimerase
MKLVNSLEMKAIDSRAINEYGIPGIVLMENAGIRCVEVIEEILGDTAGKNIVILAGPGNNGGDGLVIARHLFNAKAQVFVFTLAAPEVFPPDSRCNYEIFKNMGGQFCQLHSEADLDNLMIRLLTSDLIVDALYGNGFKGSLNEYESRLVSIVNWCNKPVVAVDIPSGVEADTGLVHGTAIKASHTVSFALPKIGQVLEPGKDYTGTLSVADISIPGSLLEDEGLKTNLITAEMVGPLIKLRPAESHKGTFGHALIIGGSTGLTGAVVMAAYAALRCGAGLVTAALPESLAPIVDGIMTEVMTAPLPEAGEAVIGLEAMAVVEDLMGTVSVGAIGPGMSDHSEAAAVLRHILQRSGIPLVIDADGLNALAGNTDVFKGRQIPLVLTPHPGEMARLTGRSVAEIQADRLESARHYAMEWGATLVLKGNKTVVADPAGNIYVNIIGNPGMATAGSGDVLCGIITGLIAQGLKATEAAIAGVYLHSRCGDWVAEHKGQRGLVAGDLIAALPDILLLFEQSSR